MYLMHFRVVGLGLYQENESIYFIVSSFDFFLLIFSTMLIAGAGYIINDYFDMRIDRINKPEKVIVGKHIKKRVAMLTHTFLNIIAVGIGTYLSIKYKNYTPLVFHLFTTFVLWMYSVFLKRKFLIGNLSIAFLSAMVPLLIALFELPALRNAYDFVDSSLPFSQQKIHFSWNFLLLFALFAFLLTLIRELIKDIADLPGDEAQHCKTVPIVWGIPKTKWLIYILSLIVVITVMGFQTYFFPNTKYAIYTVTFVALPILIATILLRFSNTRKPYLYSSNFLKLSMLGGILFTLIY